MHINYEGIESSGRKINYINPIEINENSEIKDDIKSLIDFDVEECKDLISLSLVKYKYNKKDKKLDLSSFIFGKLQILLGKYFYNYIVYPEFKSIILNVYGLKGDFKINFNIQKKEFILIDITDSKRFYSYLPEEIDGLIKDKISCDNIKDIHHLINEVIYGIDDSFKKHIGEGFKKFIFVELRKKVALLLDLEGDKIRLGLDGNDLLVDKSGVIKAISGKIYRDNYDYINNIAGHKLMGEVSKVTLDALLSDSSEGLENSINGNFEKIIKFLGDFKLNGGKESSVLEIEHLFNNNELIQFQDKLKLHFQEFNNTHIDTDLLRGAISYLIHNNNLELNITSLGNSIFALIENHTGDLVELFSKFNGSITEIDGKKYKYSKFKMSEGNNLKGEFDIKDILEEVNNLIKELRIKNRKIREKTNELEALNVKSYEYIGGTNREFDILNSINKSISILVESNIEIDEEIFKVTNTTIYLNKKNKLSKLSHEKESNTMKLISFTKKKLKLEYTLLINKRKVEGFNNINSKKEIELNNIKYRYKEDLIKYRKIKNDFILNILFGRTEVK